MRAAISLDLLVLLRWARRDAANALTQKTRETPLQSYFAAAAKYTSVYTRCPGKLRELMRRAEQVIFTGV